MIDASLNGLPLHERTRKIHESILAQQAKKPKVNASGYPLAYSAQPAEYRAAVTRADHERAHGTGHRPSHHAGRADG